MFSPIQDNSDTNSNQNFAFFDSTASDKLSDCEFLEIPLLHDTPSPNNTKKIDNDAFLSYFMKIDYGTDFLKDNELNNEMIEVNEMSSTDNSSNVSLSKKTTRDDDDILYDELTKTVYNKKEDPVAFRKAKKRIQNRESALRMKKLKQENQIKTEDQLNTLKKENEKLFNENITLKKEKNFLIEQIKYMQTILKESNIKLHHSKELPSNSSEQISFNYSGFSQKIKGKLFNVFIICVLSMIYIAGECADSGTTQSINFSMDKNIKLNTVTETKPSPFYFLWRIFAKIILIVLVILIIPWVKTLSSLIIRKTNKMKKFL